MTPAFLEAVWTMVVDPYGVTSWEEYGQVDRAARGTPLDRPQRQTAGTGRALLRTLARPGEVAVFARRKDLLQDRAHRAVAVMGVEDGTVPLDTVRVRQPDEAALRAFVEMERNLIYVACSRARERLLVTGVGGPSEFLAR